MLPPDGPDSNPRKDALEVDQGQNKAKLDDTELNVASPKALQKVELDLDDAPFLEDEPEPEAPDPEIPTAPPPSEEAAPPPIPLWKRKKIVLSGAGVLLLVIVLGTWFFVLRPTPVEPPPVVEEPAPEPPAPPVPAEPEEPPIPPEVPLTLPPFLVEKTDDKGTAHLVTIKIKILYREERLGKELELKNFSLRDGLYYNLKNKTLKELTDKNNAEPLREELRGVVNNYLNSGQIETVLFDELLVK